MNSKVIKTFCSFYKGECSLAGSRWSGRRDEGNGCSTAPDHLWWHTAVSLSIIFDHLCSDNAVYFLIIMKKSNQDLFLSVNIPQCRCFALPLLITTDYRLHHNHQDDHHHHHHNDDNANDRCDRHLAKWALGCSGSDRAITPLLSSSQSIIIVKVFMIGEKVDDNW